MQDVVLKPEVWVVRPPRSRRVVAWWKGFGRPPRVMGVDVARALAIIGMIGAHVGNAPDLVWTAPSTWLGVVHGRSSVLFAILAGVSVSLVTGRSTLLASEQIPPARLRLVGRGAAVFLIGVVLELFGTPIGVILPIYGALFVIATAFLHWNAKKLLVVGGVLALVGPPVMALLQALSMGAWGAGLSFLVFGLYPGTVWVAYLLIGMGVGRLRIDREKTAAILLGVGVVLAFVGYGLGSFAAPRGEEISWDPGGSEWGYEVKPGSEVDLTGYTCEVYDDGPSVSCYPDAMYGDFGTGAPSVSSMPWDDAASSMQDGDGFASSGSGSGEWSGDEYDYFEQLDWASIGDGMFAAVTNSSPHSGGVLDIVGSSGFALAVLGLCLLAARRLRWVLLPLAAFGSMPLTAYAVHVVSVSVMGGGPGGMMMPSGSVWLWSCVVIGVATLVWSNLWGKGPLERFVARVGTAAAREPRPHTRAL